MADNVQLDEGTSGKYAATDEVSSGIHVQKFKLLDGTLDSTNAAVVDAGGSLQTDIVSMPINTVATGTIDADEETVNCTLPAGCATVGCQLTGTWVGQINFEGSVDGTNYQPVEASNGTASVNATTGNDIFVLPGSGYVNIRVRAESWTSGSCSATLVGSVGTSASILTGALPAGANIIGKAGIDQTTPGTTNKVSIGTDGTVTANLGATDNAVLDSIDTSTAATKTAVELIDDAIYIDDADWTDSTSKHLLVGGLYQSTVQSVTDGDVGPLQVDPGGRLIAVGATAHDSPALGAPVRTGGIAQTSLPTAVAAADAVNFIADVTGRQLVRTNPLTCSVAYHAVAAADAVHSNVEIIAAPAAGLRNYITDFEITNDATAAITVLFVENTGTPAQKGGIKYIPVSGGIVSNLQTPIQCTAAVNFGFTNTGQSNFAITLYYYVAP